MKKTLAIILSILFVVGWGACQKEPGPAEKMGKQLDEAAATAKEKVGEAAESVKEKLSNGEQNSNGASMMDQTDQSMDQSDQSDNANDMSAGEEAAE